MPRLSLPLAPMSAAIRWFTVVVLLLPAVLLAVANASGPPQLNVVAASLLALYIGVWLFTRPARFELTEADLAVVFPAWRRTIGVSDGLTARMIEGKKFREEFGLPLRIGVGGLWGGFGWLWTSRRGLVEFYISRFDGMVLVERRRGRALLITPESPEALVAALAEVATAGSASMR
jgi:hypothetical protein